MLRKQVPFLSLRFWTSLVLAGAFGADAGDLFTDQLGLWVLAMFSIAFSSIQAMWD